MAQRETVETPMTFDEVPGPAPMPVTLGVPVLVNEPVSLFERLARDPAVSVENIERLMALWERTEAKKAEQAFNAAMASAQAEMRPVGKDADNPQTRSKYASYTALDVALRPIYTAHGFGLSFDTKDDEFEDAVTIMCYVSHRDGFARTYHIVMPADGKGAKGGDVMTKTHAVGSAVSYGMRYLLKMIFNVAVGEHDDDGNAASARQQQPQASAPPEGYDDWLLDMASLAESGTPGLQDAWGKSKQVYRAYVTRFEPQRWQALKVKAADADKADIAKAVQR